MSRFSQDWSTRWRAHVKSGILLDNTITWRYSTDSDYWFHFNLKPLSHDRLVTSPCERCTWRWKPEPLYYPLKTVKVVKGSLAWQNYKRQLILQWQASIFLRKRNAQLTRWCDRGGVTGFEQTRSGATNASEEGHEDWDWRHVILKYGDKC